MIFEQKKLREYSPSGRVTVYYVVYTDDTVYYTYFSLTYPERAQSHRSISYAYAHLCAFAYTSSTFHRKQSSLNRVVWSAVIIGSHIFSA